MAFFSRHKLVFHCDRFILVFGSCSCTYVFWHVVMGFIKFALLATWLFNSKNTVIRCASLHWNRLFLWMFSIQISYIPFWNSIYSSTLNNKSSNVTLRSLAISLIVNCRSFLIFSGQKAMVLFNCDDEGHPIR